jgi:hypothetical protein
LEGVEGEGEAYGNATVVEDSLPLRKGAFHEIVKLPRFDAPGFFSVEPALFAPMEDYTVDYTTNRPP